MTNADMKIIGLDDFIAIMGSHGVYENIIYEADGTGVKVKSDCGAIFGFLSADERKSVFPAKMGEYALLFPCTVDELEALATFGGGMAGDIAADALQSVIEREAFDPTGLKPAAKRSVDSENWIERAREIALDMIKNRPANVTGVVQDDIANRVSEELARQRITGKNDVSISKSYVLRHALSADSWWQKNKGAT